LKRFAGVAGASVTGAVNRHRPPPSFGPHSMQDWARWAGRTPLAERVTPLRIIAVMLVAVLGAAVAAPACAEDAFYLGTWKLDSAVVAPWADRHAKPDTAEMKSLVGKYVALKSAAVTGPKPFACKAPHYKLSDFTADMLFQGSLGEMHDADKSKDPLKLAASLGLVGTSWKTLETGCEIDWHFVDPATAEIGLDDYVYTLKKQ
jgi:hypothetical protein